MSAAPSFAPGAGLLRSGSGRYEVRCAGCAHKPSPACAVCGAPTHVHEIEGAHAVTYCAGCYALVLSLRAEAKHARDAWEAHAHDAWEAGTGKALAPAEDARRTA